tara:strand:+ start:2773 stop:3255 length:483 start_codon:yes stop_codon:yes gene_type:complete
MELYISNFNIKKSLINFCKNRGGHNIRPNIIFSKINNCNNYAIIMEDPLATVGNVVHWYVPYIKVKNDKIIKYIEGYNNTIQPGRTWVGPCPPPGTGWHNYKWIIYALEKEYIPKNSDLHINSSNDFEIILKNNNIKILDKTKKSFKIYIEENFYKKFNN